MAVPGPAHPERVQLGAEPLGRAPGPAQDPLRPRLRRDEREHALGDGLRAERVEHDGLAPRSDVFGDLAQRELAQRGQPVGAEEVLQRDAGALGRVDLPGPEPLLERLRRQVDEHDLVGLVEDPVGKRLPDADVGQLGDRVVQALEVLDVDGRDHVDPRVEHLVDVLVALLVARLRRVRVRELVDQRQLRRAADHRVDVHLLQLEPAVLERSRGTSSSPSASAVVSGRSCGSR